MSKHILVIGATGNVGRSLVPFLVERGEVVKAATRQPEAYPSQAGVTAVSFDYDQPHTYAPALAGVDRLFLIAKGADPAPQKTVNPLIDAAKAAGVNHIVLMTAMGVEQAEEIGLRQVERHLIASGVPYTILRPNWFMQNFSTGFIYPILQQGGIYLPAGEAATSQIDTRDIAAVAAAALTDPGRHAGQEYPLTGPEPLTYAQTAAILTEVAGQPITYVPISEEEMAQALSGAGWEPGQVGLMLGLFQAVRAGYAAPVSPAVADILGREPIAFSQFARDNAGVWQGLQIPA